MANNTSQHILSTSANLLGFCLFVITSLHITNYASTSLIDEFTSFIALFLIASCMFSFLSIRTASNEREIHYEKIADYLFMTALIGILIILIFIALGYLK